MLPTPLPPAALARLYLRAARRLEAEARDLADLARYGYGAARRSVRRQAAACAADARALRGLARAARAGAAPPHAPSTHAAHPRTAPTRVGGR